MKTKKVIYSLSLITTILLASPPSNNGTLTHIMVGAGTQAARFAQSYNSSNHSTSSSSSSPSKQTSNGSSLGSNDTGQQQNGLVLLLQQYDWASMWKQITFQGGLKFCWHKGPNAINEGVVGIKMTDAEPLYLGDNTMSNDRVPVLGIKIEKWDPARKGYMINDSGGAYTHLFRIPLMHMLLKHTDLSGALVFAGGYPTPVYLGNIDFKRWNDIISLALIPERAIFGNLVGNIAAAATCPLYTALDLMPLNKQISPTGFARVLKSPIDTMYYGLGCIGPIPVGTLTEHPASIANAILDSVSVMTDMYSKKGLGLSFGFYHTTLNPITHYNQDVWCNPLENPIMPLAQFTFQLLSPTVSKPHDLGVSPAVYAFHYVGITPTKHVTKVTRSAARTSIFIYTQRRDYAAEAYSRTAKLSL